MNAFTFNKDTIDLLVSAAILGVQVTDDPHGARTKGLVKIADSVGTALWKANVAAANQRWGLSLPEIDYEWLPVADLMGTAMTDVQALQVERSRREVLDHCRDHPDWDGSTAATFLEQLGGGLARRLEAWPTQPSGTQLGVLEYVGLETGTIPVWKRGAGLSATARPADSAKS